MTIRKRGVCRLQPVRLIRMYELFKKYPYKIFLPRDLRLSSWTESGYLIVLVKLGIIEEVRAFYQRKNRNGKLCIVHRKLQGYRYSQSQGTSPLLRAQSKQLPAQTVNTATTESHGAYPATLKGLGNGVKV